MGRFIKILLLGYLSFFANALNGQICDGPMTVMLGGSSTNLPLQVLVEVQGISCSSDVDGVATLIVGGGNPGYTYAWTDGLSTDSCRYFLAEGTYAVTVTDEEGCTEIRLAEVPELNAANTNLADSDGCGQCVLNNGSERFYFNDELEYIASLQDEASDNLDLGNTEVCVFFDPVISFCEGQPYLQRHWAINPGNDLNACLKLYFTQQELDDLAAAIPGGSTSAADIINNQWLCLKAYSGGNEDCSDYQTTMEYSMGAAPPLLVNLEDPVAGIWSVETCVDQLSNFYLEICQPTLPVELLYFRGEPRDAVNDLFWETVSEAELAYFEIEKSVDGVHFVFIGKEEALGDMVDNQSYFFEDQHPGSGLNYYRLKMVDTDDSFSRSHTIAIDRSQSEQRLLYPTLFTENLFFKSLARVSERVKIRVLDVSGRVVHQQSHQFQIAKELLTIPLAHLPGGAYFVQIRSMEEGFVEDYKVVKLNE